MPSQSGSLTYNGRTQYPSWSNYSSASLTLGGTTSGTNAGTYTATFTPKANYKWSDGTSTAKSVTWKIGKAAGSLSLSTSSMTIDTNSTTGSFTVTRAGNGAISASSNNTGVATVSVSGNTVTVTKKAAGTATITVKVAAGTNHTAPASKTCTVTCKTGTPIGSLPVGSSVYMNVSGVRKEFLIVNQGNPDTSMYDSSCNGTWLLMKDAYEQRAFSTANENPNQYTESSQMQQYLNGDFFAKFDSDIQGIIKQVILPSRKYGGNAGDGYTSPVYKGANGVSAKIFLLSFTELGGGSYNGSVEGEGVTLSYFSDCGENHSSAQPKRVANMNGSPVYWWIRTPGFGISADADSLLVRYTGSVDVSEVSNKASNNVNGKPYCIRPALILSSKTLVDGSGNVMAGGTVTPSVPSMQLTTSSDGHPTISWAKVSGATQYEIYRGYTDNFSIIRRTAALTYTDTTAAAGERYSYKVRSVNGDMYSDFCTRQAITCTAAAKMSIMTNGGEISGYTVSE